MDLQLKMAKLTHFVCFLLSMKNKQTTKNAIAKREGSLCYKALLLSVSFPHPHKQRLLKVVIYV